MPTCRLCQQETVVSDSCLPERWEGSVPATPYGSEEGVRKYVLDEGIELKPRCPMCGVRVGGYHHPFCDFEECPVCHGQAFGCNCVELASTGRPAIVNRFGPYLDSYSMSDAIRLTGAKRSQIENWVRSGWLVPKTAVGGTGNPREFSFANVVDISVGVRLSRFHIPFPALFRGEDPAGLRSLLAVPDKWLRMTDSQLAEVLVRGYSLGERRKIRSEQGFELAESAREWRRELHRKRQFRCADTRPREGNFYLRIWPEGTDYWWDWIVDAPVCVGDAAIVIDMRRLFEELEAETGDRWRDD